LKLTGFIFDLDGVITDTAEYHYRAWKRLADEEGIAFSREDNKALRGISRRESLLLVLKGKSCSEGDLLSLMERKSCYYRDFLQGITPADVLPGVLKLLMEIRMAEGRTALASASKNAGDVIRRLKIDWLFDAVSDGYSVDHYKPAPDLFLHAANQLGLPPEWCVVFEDAAAGIEAARIGCFRSVGIGPKERVGKAEVVFPNLENVHLRDILDLLDAQIH
jgi:beta-phosphoglucomutase